jgi:hypothetical protein
MEGMIFRDVYWNPRTGSDITRSCFSAAGIFGMVFWLIISLVILGIGHIGIHLQHIKNLEGRI